MRAVKNIANNRTTEIPDKSLFQQIYLKSFSGAAAVQWKAGGYCNAMLSGERERGCGQVVWSAISPLFVNL